MKTHRINSLLLTGLGSCMVIAQAQESPKVNKDSQKPNVLFIIMDDMCDWANFLGGNNQVITPNLDRLASRGVVFSNAYTAAPLSNPSRGALLTGIPPYISGVYNNTHNLSNFPVVNNSLFMPQHFKNNGYKTIISGKIFHTKPSENILKAMWDDMTNIDGGYGPFVKNSTFPPELQRKWMDYQEWTGPDTDFADVRNSQKIVDFIQQTHDKPFFAAMGLYRPHNPYTAPKRFFDLYDINNIVLPEKLADDLNDIPPYAINNFIKERAYNAQLHESGNYAQQLVRAYLASVSFADAQVGKILDALDASPYAENTLIVLIGDNGFHHGEKERWGKSALWREANHVPFLIIPPKNSDEFTPETCSKPVSLLDIYPTLIDLCGLTPVENQLVGNSLIPLLNNVNYTWDKPAVSTFLPGNFVVHYNKWNFIKYVNNSYELYDTEADENEFFNLAKKPEYQFMVDSLKKFLPETWVVGVPENPVESVSEDFSSDEWDSEFRRLNPTYIRPAAGSAFPNINNVDRYFGKYLLKGAVASITGTPNCELIDIIHGDNTTATAFRLANTGSSSYMEFPPLFNVSNVKLHIRNANSIIPTTITLQKFDAEGWVSVAVLPVQPAETYNSKSVDEIIDFSLDLNEETKLRIHGGDRFVHIFRVDIAPYIKSGQGLIEENNKLKFFGRRVITEIPTKLFLYNSLGLLVFKDKLITETTIPLNVDKGIYLVKSDFGTQKVWIKE